MEELGETMSAYPPIADLLPHRPPMLLLREVISHSPEETRCEAIIDADFAAACGGEAPAAFALEMIAQAAAAHHGLCLREPGPRATRGLLLGSRRFQLNGRALPTGQPLQVIVIGAAAPSGGLIRFEGRVEDLAGRVLASGDATVLESPAEVALA